MSTTAPAAPTTAARRGRTVYVGSTGQEQRPYEYATLRESVEQRDRWIGEAIRYCYEVRGQRAGRLGYRVTHGQLAIAVGSFANGGVSVDEVRNGRVVRSWSHGEVVACLQRRFGKAEAELIRHRR